MIFKSASVKTLDQAAAVLDELKHTYQSQIDAGTLTDTDRERIRRRLKLAEDLEMRSRTESSFSLLGDLIATFQRFFKTGRWGMTTEEYVHEMQKLRQRAEAQMKAIPDHS